MRLTQKFLAAINRVFDKTPDSSLGIIFRYAGDGMTWTVDDAVLTTAVTGGVGAGFSVDLTQYTLFGLAQFISAQTGYTVTAIDPDAADLSAAILLDASGDQNQSNGDHLYYFKSLLFMYFEAMAQELSDLRATIVSGLQQINIFNADGSQGSTGYWLDFQGGYFNVPRMQGESDPGYAPRIVAEVLRPKGNNIAIEVAIEAYTGQEATVTDVILPGPSTPLFDGSITFNGAHNYNATSSPLYGLFDVNTAYDLINGGDITSFQSVVESLIDRLRDAGMHLRALALGSTAISENANQPVDAGIGNISGMFTISDNLDAPTEAMGTGTVNLATGFKDNSAGSTESTDLVTSYTTKFDGSRNFDGKVKYLGGFKQDTDISGGTINSTVPL